MSPLNAAITQSRYLYAVRVVAILLEDVALRVGVAGDVEPVTAPALAELRRREQPVDGLFVLGVAGIGGELFQLGRRRRQAGEIVVQPAEQRRGVGRGRRLQAAASSCARMKASMTVRGQARVPLTARSGAL